MPDDNPSKPARPYKPCAPTKGKPPQSPKPDPDSPLSNRPRGPGDPKKPGTTARATGSASKSLEASLNDSSGGSALAYQNLYRAGAVVNAYILQHWVAWEQGVPPLP